jgi:hypothetical protein
VQGASFAVYSLVISPTAKLDATSALELAKKTFPGIANRKYVASTTTTGFAWTFTGTTTGLDPKTKKATVIAESIILYVLPSSNGKFATVTATVGRGDFATALK